MSNISFVHLVPSPYLDFSLRYQKHLLNPLVFFLQAIDLLKEPDYLPRIPLKIASLSCCLACVSYKLEVTSGSLIRFRLNFFTDFLIYKIWSEHSNS